VLVVLALNKKASAVFIKLNSADCFKSERLGGKQSSTSACEKSQLIHNHQTN